MSKINGIFFAVLIIFISVFAVHKAWHTLTYVEYETLNDKSDTYLVIDNNDTEFVQEFEAPYDLFCGVGLKIGTFDRDNNSQWEVLVTEAGSQKQIWKESFNASQAEDNSFYVIESDHNISLNKDKFYELHIYSPDVNPETAIAFYCSDESEIERAGLYVNDMVWDGDLCIQIYGGNYDSWWIRFILFCIFVVLAAGGRYVYLRMQGGRALEDRVFSALLISIVVFVLLCTFSVSDLFIDENDNILGGMIIAKGGVLYRDYITQHTPVPYYLCAVAAVFGAGSLQQFRLSYYILQAAVWGFLYDRHAVHIGKRRMIFIPVLNTVLLPVIVPPCSYMILADCIQGLCMTALAMEFLAYSKDKEIGWGRASIVSICIWGSFGSAFISVYALAPIVFVVLFVEIYEWKKRGGTGAGMIEKFCKLAIAVIFPLAVTLLYFWYHGALKQAYMQAFKFNTEVYPVYSGGFGTNKLEPFINAFKDFFGFFLENVGKVLASEAGNQVMIQLLVFIGVVITLIQLLVKKEYLTAAFLYLVMICNATRGYDFHGIAAWHIAILIIVLFGSMQMDISLKLRSVITGCLFVYVCGGYISRVGHNLLQEPKAVDKIEHAVVAATDDGDDIFIDEWSFCSIYLMYKNRYPVNRNVLFLPWYLDWFEGDLIQDLKEHMPEIVVYDENKVTLDIYTDCSQAFAKVLKKYYRPYPTEAAEGWEHCLWIKKTNRKE